MYRFLVLGCGPQANAVELEGFESDSALMEAVEGSYSDIINFLLEQNADVLKKNPEGKSVMDLTDEGTNIVVTKPRIRFVL